MSSFELEAFLDQQPLQPPAATEGEHHVQLVDSAHQLQIGTRHRTKFVLAASPADPQYDAWRLTLNFAVG